MSTTNENKAATRKIEYWVPAALFAGLALAACLLVTSISIGRIFSNRTGEVALQQVPLQGAEIEKVLENVHVVVEKASEEAVPLSPHEAQVQTQQGLVEAMDETGQWQAVLSGSVLHAGMHLRTGGLSNATLAFFDGSRVTLGPRSELVIEQLQAGTGDADRVVVLTQLSGESEHEVVTSTAEGSLYEVHTEAGVGKARGTSFVVVVNPALGSFFRVTHGVVAVTWLHATVLVESGQATVVYPQEVPAQPTYFFTGQGAVAFIGETWLVEGQSLSTHSGTVVIGSPQVGDEVYFQGRLQPDNTRLVDMIVLLRRSPVNRFSLTGIVEASQDIFWIVNGQEIAVTDITLIDPQIADGDLVRIDGIILAGGTMQAESILRLEDAPGLPFDFVGIIQSISEESWVVSDVDLILTETTILEEGLDVGVLVRAQGWILEDGTWLARSIERTLDETRAFEFSGPLESMDPWIAAGIAFETLEWTEIQAGLQVGDQVTVKGQVMLDGSWMAYEIYRTVELTDLRVILVGRVVSMDPWVISGVTLNLDEDTLVSDSVVVGLLVRVEIQVLEDGTWKVLRIDPLGLLEWMNGCQEITALVLSFSGNQVQLEGWPLMLIDDEAQLLGALKPNTIVLVQICWDEDGNPRIVYIYIILEPLTEAEIPGIELPGGKVTICHKPNGKNPHTIVVSQSAVPAHLGHGDYLGPCR